MQLLQSDEGMITFWVERRETYPTLQRCALESFVTPSTSTPSERNFSMLSLLVTTGRSRMKDDIINAFGRVRSALMEEVQRPVICLSI